MGGAFGSGLPVELDTGTIDLAFLRSQFGPAIIDHVNFGRGRVRPSFALDFSAGVELYRKEHRSASLQVAVANLTDHLNVLNFESLFSGTAVSPPRSASAGLRLSF